MTAPPGRAILRALVAVTKSVGADLAAGLCRLGQRELGESRAAELERKDDRLRALGLDPRWHFDGHLQGNKVRRVVARAASIHSIDSLRLLESVDRTAGELGLRPEVWIQVKLADEPTKSGLDPAELPGVLARAAELPNVALAGLMTIAPLSSEPDREGDARSVFRRLARLAREEPLDLAPKGPMREAKRLGSLRTSMGMSGDFEAAIEEGSDLVRVGSLLFEGVVPPRGEAG